MTAFIVVALIVLGIEITVILLGRRRRALDALDARQTDRNIVLFRDIRAMPDAPEIKLLGRKAARPRPLR